MESQRESDGKISRKNNRKNRKITNQSPLEESVRNGQKSVSAEMVKFPQTKPNGKSTRREEKNVAGAKINSFCKPKPLYYSVCFLLQCLLFLCLCLFSFFVLMYSYFASFLFLEHSLVHSFIMNGND